MLPVFTQKLEQVKQARQQAWKPVRAIEQEITQLNEQFEELDGFLQDLLSDEKQENAFTIKIQEKQRELKENHPILGTDKIDTALHIWTEDEVIEDNLLKDLCKICKEHNDAQMCRQAALLLFTLSHKQMRINCNIDTYERYKTLLTEASDVLLKTEDADLVYAQWGKTLYESGAMMLAKEDAKDLCLIACKDAYDKFGKVKTKVEGIELYLDFVPGHEEHEVELFMMVANDKSLNLKESIQKLLDDQTDVQRELIRNYRGQVLKKIFKPCIQLLEEKRSELRACANTFSVDVEEVFRDHEKRVYANAQNVNRLRVIDFVHRKVYVKAIPKEYQHIDTAKYEMELSADLQKKAQQYVPKHIHFEWIAEHTKAFVNQNKVRFEEWLEAYIKANCVPNYKKKMEEKIRVGAKELPKCAKKYSRIADYQLELYKRCIDEAHCAQIKEDAWKNRWIEDVPDAAIEQYLKQEEKKFNTELKQENMEGGLQNFTEAVGNFILDHKFLFIVGIIVLLYFGLKFLENTVPIGLNGVATVSDEQLWEEKEKAIGKIEAELSPTATPASDFTYEAVDYVGSSDVIEIVSYNGTDEAVEIPAVIDGMNVAYIRDGAFRDNMFLKRVVMPDTIHGIRDGAFENCTNLEEVVFSKNLTFVLNNAFKNCTSLKSIQMESDVSSLDSIASSVFADCTALETVTIQSDVYSIVTLGDYAFAGCTSLKEINVNGENLQGVELRGHAFENCTSLETLLFADKVTTLGEGVFKGCTSLNNISLPNITNIPKETFYGCTALSTFHIANTITGIEDMAFRECTNLATVTFDETPLEEDGTGRYIRDHAFAYSGLTEIELPGYYEAVDNWAFRDTPLTTFVWHAGKGINQSLSTNAFGECDSLREVYLPKTIKEMRDAQDVFYSSTIYAAEGGAAYNYAMEHNYPWSTWTE